MVDFLDVNAWVTLSTPVHPDHVRANRYWANEAADVVAFGRTTALGLVRVTTGKHAVGGTPLTLPHAWAVYRQWREESFVIFLEDPPAVEEILHTFIENLNLTPRLWTDAYLAAFAVAGNLRLVTFDKDFERFPGLNLLRL